MKLLFIANKLEYLVPEVDTTVFLMQGAWKEKYEVWFSTLQDIGINTSRELSHYVNASYITPCNSSTWYETKVTSKEDLLSFSAIIIRTDPPFDQEYLLGTNILDFVATRGVRVINAPQALRKFNEKLIALKFPDYIPPTLISSNKDEIIDFLQSRKQIVLKPLNLMGGQGVFLLNVGDYNLNAIIDSMTSRGRDKIVSQEFLVNIKEGDKRIIIINGNVEKFALCRKPRENSIVANLAGGGTFSIVKLNEEELEIANIVASNIQSDIFFAGLDMIDKKITEINITSPTGMRQIAEFKSPHLATLFFNQLKNLKQ
tara:strand:- start:5464 stop:6408 length:945 start_codon:yes stop_codon:yes gene_type:complete